jgi:hypothetical protein
VANVLGRGDSIYDSNPMALAQTFGGAVVERERSIPRAGAPGRVPGGAFNARGRQQPSQTTLS